MNPLQKLLFPNHEASKKHSPIGRLLAGALLAAATLAQGQSYPTITSFSPNGLLTFTEVSNAFRYRVEWSTNLAQSSWRTSSPPGVVGILPTGIGTLGTRSVTVGVAQAASFYRVVAVTNPPSARPRGSYYINFQPNGLPPSPLVFDGKTWIQVDWKTPAGAWLDYVPGAAPFYGWIRDSAQQQLSTYRLTPTNYNALERSYVFDDYGRSNVFQFELESGRYLVTVGVGRPGGSTDPHNLRVEDQVLVNDEVLTDIQARTLDLQLTDGALTLTFGGRSPSLGFYAYTYLAYLKVEPID